jgi:hypothetical protein
VQCYYETPRCTRLCSAGSDDHRRTLYIYDGNSASHSTYSLSPSHQILDPLATIHDPPHHIHLLVYPLPHISLSPTPSPQYPSTRNPTIEQTITMKFTTTIAVLTFALSATAATSSCGTAQTCNAQAMNEGFDELKKGGRRSLGLTARAREWVKTTMASEENVARDADNSGKLPTVDSVVINKA